MTEKALDWVSELLAVMHKDGGHCEDEYGREKACQEAIKIYYELLEKLAEK